MVRPGMDRICKAPAPMMDVHTIKLLYKWAPTSDIAALDVQNRVSIATPHLPRMQ